MVLTVLSIILQLISFPIGVYYLIIGAAGFLPKKEKRGHHNYHRFALIICAHNEETVIANSVISLKKQNYPEDKFDVFVVADNCSDSTAEKARAAGAVVYVRTDDKNKGKGQALGWFFEKPVLSENHYDYVSVFDADNLVDEDYLKHMNESACRGQKIVQCFLDSKNPYDTWISASYSFCFWVMNRIFQLSRHKLGLCCELSGTGFIIETELLKRLGWRTDCLTEDMEFTMKAAYAGEKIYFNYDARVYDEKPLTLRQSWKQRLRWMRGHCYVASRYFFKLLKKGIREKSLSLIDCAVYLVQPIRIIAMGIILFFSYAQTFFPNGDLGFIQLSYLFGTPAFWNIITILQLCYMPFLVIYERREIKPVMLWYFAMYSVYNLTWIPIAVWGFLTHKNKSWSHTRHVRNVNLEDVKRG